MGGLLKKLYETLLHNQNQFASGGILLMALGSIIAMLRNIPTRIWEWFKGQVTINMTITDDSSAFKWVVYWYSKQKHSKRSRNVDVVIAYVNNEPVAAFAPAPGNHWFFHNRRPLFVEFQRSDSNNKKGGGVPSGGVNSIRRYETFVIWTFGRSQKYLRNLILEMEAAYDEDTKDKATLFVWEHGWEPVTGYKPRSFESVILPAEQKQRIIDDINQFREDKAFYEAMGIPYHHGVLFWGPPGTGKTSSVIGLSDLYHCNVYLIKLSDHNDASFVSIVNRCEENSFIVLEDVDCVIPMRDTPNANPRFAKNYSVQKGGYVGNADVTACDEGMGPATTQPPSNQPVDGKDNGNRTVTLSGLLNTLDGFQAPSGVIFFLTTNHVDKLDAALLRPGRVDLKEFLGPAETAQLVALYQRFFPEDHPAQIAAFVKPLEGTELTMAMFQQKLMQERGRRKKPVGPPPPRFFVATANDGPKAFHGHEETGDWKLNPNNNRSVCDKEDKKYR